MLEAKECDDVERMKAGIIGCGIISSVYLENLQKSPLIEVVAVADLLDERGQRRGPMNSTLKTYTKRMNYSSA